MWLESAPMNTKWVWIVLLLVVGIVAAVFAGEYLSTNIAHLPSWVPGHHAGYKGHMHKRGAVLALVALLAFAGAGWLIYKVVKEPKPGAGSGTAAGAGPGPGQAPA